MICSDDK